MGPAMFSLRIDSWASQQPQPLRPLNLEIPLIKNFSAPRKSTSDVERKGSEN